MTTARPAFDLCVVGGLGHVGLPLAIAFATHGNRVAVVDIDAAARSRVRAGEMPFIERGAEEPLRRALSANALVVSDEPDVIAQSDALVLTVGTPIDGHLAPSLKALQRVIKEYQPWLHDGHLVILRSTLYPGTSARVQRLFHDAQLAVDLAVCPERIAQGYGLEEIETLPQIVASFTATGLARAKALFGAVAPELIEMEPIEAELAKLFNNAWRYIKFAAANQFFMIANDCGADYERVYRGMTQNYPRGADLPSPGFASGPCLYKDTMQLAAFTNNQFMLGHSAMLVNEGLPYYIAARLRRRYRDVRTIGILGMAFKANVDDPRDSLSYKLRDLLTMDYESVICTDPYIDDTSFVSLGEALERSDVLIVATPHREYKNLSVGEKPVIDIWNILGRGISSL